jgi:pimeloyl-ACP methyl ester carboxylesterase
VRGAARLAVDATLAVTDLVEAMHAGITRIPGTGAAPGGRTRGLTGLVYGAVRGITRGVGGGLDALLRVLEPALGPPAEVPEREALRAALNGVMGDHLRDSGNPLATPMTLRFEGAALPAEAVGLAPRLQGAGPKALVLIHGLCMNELQWRRGDQELGEALARAQGWTVLRLRYNSGLHVSDNGRTLAALLEPLCEAWPVPLTRLALVGHSMGGLLARSAVHQARGAGQAWPDRLTDLMCLGTPHHGAPLERAGHVFERALGAAPYAAPLAKLGRLRSAGITDLRHGNLLEGDWAGEDRFASARDRRHPVPLPPGVNCGAIAALLGEGEGALKGRLLGDGLVALDSALGRHREAARRLEFRADRQRVLTGLDHFALMHDPQVLATLADWLAAPA